MTLEYDLAIGIASGGLGAVLGSAVTFARNRRQFRFQYQYWGFLNEPSAFVVGDMVSEVLLNTITQVLELYSFDDDLREQLRNDLVHHVRRQEISGLVGRGDFLSVASTLMTLSLLRLPRRPLILHPNEANEHRGDNLVLIGGSDVNSLTKEIAPQIGCHLEPRIGPDGRNSVRDHRLDNWHTVTAVALNGGDTIHHDYGVIARGRNPNNPKRDVLILAGAHGWGTLAACEISASLANQNRLCQDMRRWPDGFEGLIKCTSLNNRPPSPSNCSIEFTRELLPRPG